MKAYKVWVLALALFLVGGALFVYKWQGLGYPLLPEEETRIWTVETTVSFDAGEKSMPVKATLHIPGLTPGFALLDVWEPCTAYYARANKLTKKGLAESMERLGFAAGVVVRRELPEYAAASRQAASAERGGPILAAGPLEPAHRSTLGRRFGLLVAGSAGDKAGFLSVV